MPPRGVSEESRARRGRGWLAAGKKRSPHGRAPGSLVRAAAGLGLLLRRIIGGRAAYFECVWEKVKGRCGALRTRAACSSWTIPSSWEHPSKYSPVMPETGEPHQLDYHARKKPQP